MTGRAPIEDVQEGEDGGVVLIGDTYYWEGTDETVGPAELHEMGLCNSSECDWCGEEEEERDDGD